MKELGKIYIIGSSKIANDPLFLSALSEAKLTPIYVSSEAEIPEGEKGIVCGDDFMMPTSKPIEIKAHELPLLSAWMEKDYRVSNEPFYKRFDKKGGKKQKRKY